MAGGNIYNDRDSMDINELAALNEDISPELIEQLQQKISVDATNLKSVEAPPEFNEKDDTTLFEEPAKPVAQDVQQPSEMQVEHESLPDITEESQEVAKTETEEPTQMAAETVAEPENKNITEEEKTAPDAMPEEPQPISKISEGKILEKTLTPEQKSYNDSLDYLDGNVKYSKYVIYIDPQNVNFIEGLTVKERKNLINKILREQDDIKITKQRFKKIQSVISHSIVAILTIAISVPIIYYTINTCLEATINNYRRSQSNFQTLYRENGKITNIKH